MLRQIVGPTYVTIIIVSMNECKYKKIYVLSIYYLGQTRTPNELVFNANSCASATLMSVARFKHRTSQRHLFTMLICRGINILTKRRPEEHNSTQTECFLRGTPS